MASRTTRHSSDSRKRTPAPASRTAGGNRSASKRRTTAGRSRNTRTQNGFRWGAEVILFVVIAFAVILFLSNFGLAGKLGTKLNTVSFGTFGVVSYILPFWLFLFCAFLLSNLRQKGIEHTRMVMKSVAACAFLWSLCTFCHLASFGKETAAFSTFFLRCHEGHKGGGVFGALIGRGMASGLGLLVAFIIAILVLILSIVLMMERSFFADLAGRSTDALGFANDSARRRKQQRREKRQERRKAAALERMEKQKEEPAFKRMQPRKGGALKDREKAQGLGSDLTLRPDRKESVSDELGEISTALERELTGMESVKQEPEARRTKPAIHVAGGADIEEIPFETEETEFVSQDINPVKTPVVSDAEAPGAALTAAAAVKGRKPVSDPADNAAVEKQIRAQSMQRKKKYVFPLYRLLSKATGGSGDSRAHLEEMSEKLQRTLDTFGVAAHVTDVTCGPSVTRYEIQPEMGVKVSKIVSLADDIKLNLAVADVRIEAPVPNKSVVGIEVPNKENVMVSFRDMVESKEFKEHPSKLVFGAGRDIAGKIILADIAKMPHVLIAGATGSGKSVCINTIIMSVLYKATPEEVKLIMIDPKVVELSAYNGIPHLLLPVVTDPKKAAGALNWAVAEMTDRYQRFAEYHVRDIKAYNRKIDTLTGIEGEKPERMPQILIIVDELADLMMAAPGDVESAICRLAQLARAAGIHLVIATQRPSVNVITGLIKANMPSRIAFAVTSGIDSRTILDMNGAEKLLGKGDMLYFPQSYQKPLRVQGAFVSDREVADVVAYVIEKNGDTVYDPELDEKVNMASAGGAAFAGGSGGSDRDEYFADAGRFVIEKEKGSIGMLQRMFKIGFNRAARIMDQLSDAGVVGPEEGTRPRKVLMTAEEFENYLRNE